MSYLLRVDTSPRAEASYSRQLADALQSRILKSHGIESVVTRDLAQGPVPHIQQDTITGFYTPPDAMTPSLVEATELSDILIDELKGATAVLVSAPIYNFSMPSSLKAWIDQIVRIGHTFSYDGENFGGLVPASHAYLALSYGAMGYEESGPMRGMNFLEPYLTALFGFLGVETVEAFDVQGTTAEEAVVAAAHEAAITRIANRFAA